MTKKNGKMSSSWVRKLNIIQMAILPSVIYTFNTIPIKIPMDFLTEMEKPILKYIQSYRGPKQPKQCWMWRTKLENSTPQFQSLLWSSSKQSGTGMNIKNRTEGPEIHSHIHAQLTLSSGAEWGNCMSTGETVNVKLHLTPYANINSHWITA